MSFLHVLVISATSSSSLLGSTSAGNSAGSALAVGGVEAKVDVFLAISANKEGGNVDSLLAHANVSLSNENTGMVDGLGEALLEDLGLQSALHQSLGGELEDIIEGVLLVGHEAVALEAADEGGGLEQSLGVLGVKSQEDTGGLYEGMKRMHYALWMADEKIIVRIRVVSRGGGGQKKMHSRLYHIMFGW